ncbi:MULTISPECIES: asparagine synthase (glutamine-hydrolyzing) [unclassified Streptomyces]|uniref:asparagine synthase (glutamine-hydrolyzing) n=1 Tax=unclassified Streptomyces TaxID=2593676 RepID=UPI000DAE766E|nr:MULTISPECIES: asparagine synthase (glutamine-hydrolyzing) [unclassified Streptomyces]PZT77245.1 asparagine synthase (glutamine-hydrolyzing) [Streptomyces sp. AC1-42W]PZT78803.1 asparagine synthase (glutamine-hydrolyzing) [Streptomyces sp. AC1-42T]
MCGLAGVISTSGTTLPPETRNTLLAMAAAVAHRGPDDEQFLLDGRVGLAYRRLSVIDPAGGAQPLTSPDGSLVLIANGEIYNHRELLAGLPGVRPRTGSDCEVLLHLYRARGLDFLAEVRGMFAFALWDRTRGTLLLGRDRFGIKPLYLHRDGTRAVFGSEVKALFSDPRTPRAIDWPAALADPMLSATPTLSDAPPTSWFQGIEQVPAGAVLEIDSANGRTRTHRYWQLPTPGGDSDASDDEFAAAYRDLLASSVAEHTAADVEVGLFLSGGIDSVAVAALAARTASLQTFTVLSGSTLVNGDAEHAHRSAASLGLTNHQVLFGPQDIPTAEEWKRLLWLLETPLCGPEQFYKAGLHRYARSARPDLKVILVGQGSDEFNGGYSVGLGGGNWADHEESLRQMARRRALTDRPELAAWWEHSDLPLLSDRALTAGGHHALDDPYAAYTASKFRDLQQYNCWHEDRTASGSGIETRVPFLDHRLVELLATIPRHRRPALLLDKRILRLAVADLVDPVLAARPKVPFFYGEGRRHAFTTMVSMLARSGDALLEEALSAPGARTHVSADAARATLRRLEADCESAHVDFLLRLVNLGLLESMTTDLPAPPAQYSHTVPTALPIGDWDASADGLAARFSAAPGAAIDPDLIPALAPEVLLAHAPALDDGWLILVDGTIEYVVDPQESASWLAVLRAIDGVRSLKEILAAVDCSLEDVLEPLDEALLAGLVQLGAPVDAAR